MTTKSALIRVKELLDFACTHKESPFGDGPVEEVVDGTLRLKLENGQIVRISVQLDEQLTTVEFDQPVNPPEDGDAPPE